MPNRKFYQRNKSNPLNFYNLDKAGKHFAFEFIFNKEDCTSIQYENELQKNLEFSEKLMTTLMGYVIDIPVDDKILNQIIDWIFVMDSSSMCDKEDPDRYLSDVRGAINKNYFDSKYYYGSPKHEKLKSYFHLIVEDDFIASRYYHPNEITDIGKKHLLRLLSKYNISFRAQVHRRDFRMRIDRMKALEFRTTIDDDDLLL